MQCQSFSDVTAHSKVHVKDAAKASCQFSCSVSVVKLGAKLQCLCCVPGILADSISCSDVQELQMQFANEPA